MGFRIKKGLEAGRTSLAGFGLLFGDVQPKNILAC